MKKFFETISSKLELLRDGQLNETELNELIDGQQALLRMLFHESYDGMMLIDETARCIAANQAQLDMLGYSREELLKLYVWDWDVKFDKSAIMDMVDRNGSTGFRFETIHKRKDGTTFPVEVSTNGLKQDGHTYGFCICRDMSEQKQREELVRQLSITDALTNLINRREFTSVVDKEIERAERYGQMFSLLMYDLDFFKSINDSYGHYVGDEVLVQLTAMLQNEIRQTDVQARWGGEEFMILLPGTRLNEAERFAEKLRKLVEQAHFHFEHRVTISIGLTEYQPGDSIDAILKRVDDALYHSKERGRNRVEVL